jgi:ethanolamine utilization protein EutP (predicted NTPase)
MFVSVMGRSIINNNLINFLSNNPILYQKTINYKYKKHVDTEENFMQQNT